MSLPITIQYNDSTPPVGRIELNETGASLPLHNFVLLPQVMVDKEHGRVEVISYSLVPYTQVMPPELWKAKLEEMGIMEGDTSKLTNNFRIGTCHRCDMSVFFEPGRNNHILISGFGLAPDIYWHMSCAQAENEDHNSDWFGIMFDK